jgi:hypothetical protein
MGNPSTPQMGRTHLGAKLAFRQLLYPISLQQNYLTTGHCHKWATLQRHKWAALTLVQNRHFANCSIRSLCNITT